LLVNNSSFAVCAVNHPAIDRAQETKIVRRLIRIPRPYNYVPSISMLFLVIISY
jgi:hypothetical protein